MTDPATNRLSRSGVVMGRPLQSPMGPRIRFPRSVSSPDTSSSRDSMSISSEPSPVYPLSPARSESTLPPISEQASIFESLSPTLPPQSPTYKPIPKSAKLAPAPSLNFEFDPVPWKGLPMEAALWTLDSRELQELVSRAIRSSGRESFIRLLSPDNLDHVLPAEVERLNGLKAMTQSKYRFLVQRRTMLLQALNSSSGAPDRGADDGISVISKLALQLSQTTAECDEILEQLLRISDQLAQISKIMDRHSASALAVALRKLNKSYARRTSELRDARDKVKQLEAELEDAWKEAEHIAREMDNYVTIGIEESDDDEGEVAIIETAEKITIPTSPLSPKPGMLPLGGTIVQVEPLLESLPVMSPLSPMPTVSAVIPRTPGLIFSEEEQPPMTPPSQDTVSVRSTRSGKSAKSGRSARSSRAADVTRLSLVSAAKTRSHRTSKGSLRLPKSISRPKTPGDEHPPMPDLPIEFASSPIPPYSPVASSQLHWHHSRGASLSHTPTPSARMRRTSVDNISSSRPLSLYAPTVTMDDIYVRPQITRVRDEIQVVPRTPPTQPSSSSASLVLAFHSDLIPSPDRPTGTIPSMWLHADVAQPAAVSKKPAERLGELPAPTKKPSYLKFKTLTKRYSMPFSLFRDRPPSSSSSMSRPTSHRSS